MASKAKTYGKKATRGLGVDFAKLQISPSPTKDEERTPLVERSGNERSGPLTGQPPRVLPPGGALGGKFAADVASAVPDTVPAVPLSSGNLACGSKVTDESNLPSSNLPIRDATTSAAVSNGDAGDIIEQPTLPAGPTLRSRLRRKLKPTESAKLTAVDLEYLAPLTKIDEVISQVGEMEDWYLEWTRNCKITKIAEGSFGSILRLQNKTNPTQFTIGKLMPLRSRQGVGSKTRSFTRVHDAATEAEMLITMSNYQGFAEFRRAEILHGKFPCLLQADWKRFDDEHVPEAKSTTKFAKDQLWLFLEMSYAGTDLEEILGGRSSTNESLSVRETWDIFWAVALALGRGEAEFQFEHRDLQIQNICIKRESSFLDVQADDSRLGIQRYTNLDITIIDYTLSRATLEGSRTIFNPMEDGAIFDGQGADPDEVLQYDTYRSMRQLVQKSSATLTKGRKDSVKWEAYVPATNILWLYYLLTTLLRHTASDNEHEGLAAQEDDEIRADLKQLCRKLGPEYSKRGGYKSAMDLVNPARHTLEEMLGAAKISQGGDGKGEEESIWANV